MFRFLQIGAEFFVATAAALILYWLGAPIANKLLRTLGDLAWGGPIAWLFLAAVVFVPLYGGFSLILAAGLIKRRLALIAGPIAALVMVHFYEAQKERSDAQAVLELADTMRAMEIRPFLATSVQDILLVQDEPSCDWLCMQVLAKSSFSYAGYRDQDPVIYRRATGEACLTPQAIESYVAFLEAGLPGVCAVAESWSPAGRYISVRTLQHTPDSRARRSSEPYFDGRTIEAAEHGGTEDRVIGRWTGGVVEVPHRVSAFSLLHRTREMVGDRPELSEFVSRMLGYEITRWPRPTQEQIPGILDSLIPAFDRDGARARAIDAYKKIVAGAAGEPQATILAQAERSVTSGRRGQIIAGLSLMASLTAWRKPNVEFAKPYILDALATDDDELVYAALRSLYAFTDDDRGFAFQAALEVPFGAALPASRSGMPTLLLKHLCEFRDSPAANFRARARAALESNALANVQFAPLLVVLAKGNEATRAEAFRVVLGLTGERFETTIDVISDKGWKCIAGTNDDDWNESELRALVERAKQVPNERLGKYVWSLKRSQKFDSVRPAVRELVRERVETARTDSSTTERVRDSLEELLEELS